MMESYYLVQADLELLEWSDSFTNTMWNSIYCTAFSRGLGTIVKEEAGKV